jgi:hypothetical protein
MNVETTNLKPNNTFINVDTVARDWGVSKSHAYYIIRKLNKDLLEHNPSAITIAGKVNKWWYDEVCLRHKASNM